MNSTQIVAICIAAVVIAAAGAVVFINMNDDNGADNVMDMTWEEILEDAGCRLGSVGDLFKGFMHDD
ncbi:MAG: hypothetical protein IKC93_00515 [Candidatus Methanomethylophilaceae archaeon]|nr:hypothetical protein [Candidatus Methanomethylophilaceae archaeon]